MSQPENMGGHETVAMPSANGQLMSPVLSPITEHGGTEYAFPELDDTEGTTEDVDSGEQHDHGSRRRGRRRRSSDTRTFRLSSRQIRDLTTSPDSLPMRRLEDDLPEGLESSSTGNREEPAVNEARDRATDQIIDVPEVSYSTATRPESSQPSNSARAPAMPLKHRKHSSSKLPRSKPQLTQINTDEANSNRPNNALKPSPSTGRQPSPMPPVLPLPPLSLPTYLHLELSSSRPSALYIHRSATSDFPYEESKVKFERLLNFLLLPPNLEQVLWFGAIACLDAWLYTFTILPLRFIKASAILVRWWGRNAAQEALDVATFVYGGLGRLWARRKQDAVPNSRQPSVVQSQSESEQSQRQSEDPSGSQAYKLNGYSTPASSEGRPRKRSFRHRRTRSTPSILLPNHKADLLQGLLIICSCTVLMWFDASRMYHSIRGQAAIKLYVIYNVLEVFDRLFAAIGQDVLECLFSKETLERNSDGRSKVLRPLWMFALALVYNVVHATALFYQVITLNVAVNSYSNALLTLLMSNQFVEIKGTVFKKFEKENLFQLTCADVVERFQLWLMLLIIALRNVVEVGGLTISLNTAFGSGGTPLSSNPITNTSSIPLTSGFVIPKAFTLLPKWTGEVLGPFMIVLGSEAVVDWCKHAYITKFNNNDRSIYGRFLDVLAKDYYSHAFADQNLTKRLGLPVIPLSCLFIRACLQTYHMFLATRVPAPFFPSSPGDATALLTSSSSTSLLSPLSSSSSPPPPFPPLTGSTSSAATSQALQHIDRIFRRALGRSSFGAGASPSEAPWSWVWGWSVDDVIAFATMATFFLALYLVLLAFKLVLGMSLLSFARRRYRGMKERERAGGLGTQGSRRVGGWGTVEVGEDKRRWIYDDDPEGLAALREREARGRAKAEKGEMRLDNVDRYNMVAKRIW